MDAENSPRRRAALVVNAGAGTGDCPALARQALAQLQSAGVEAELVLAHSGAEVVAATDDAIARGVDVVAAGGGDGTQSAVASRLAGTAVAQAVLPLGTLNHFAKDLGIPLDLAQAVALVTQGRVLEVDVGEVNGRTFINNSSLGLYPDIVLDREQQRRRLGKGKWRALVSASLHAARRYPMLAVHVEANGQPLVRHTPFVFIGNNVYTMEGFGIGEREVLTGGELALYITRHPGRFRLFALALRALFRRLEQARDFEVLTGAEFTVDTRKHHQHVATDGEVTVMRPPLRYRIRRRALRVLVPAGETAPVGK